METTQPSGRIKTTVAKSGMALPEGGRIKIGMIAPGKNYPMSIDYFRATGTFAEQFHKVMGAKPDKLTIVFISDTLADSCNEEYACWEKGKRWGWGDGETYTVWDSKLKEYVPNVPADDERVTSKKWDVMLTMRFVIPELKGILAHWVFATKGAKTTIPSLVKSFDFVKDRVGTIIGVPFELVVEKVKGYSPTDPKQYSRVKLVPCFGEEYMIKVKEFLHSGKSMAQLAPLMVSEAKMLASSNQSSDAPAVTLDAEEIKNEDSFMKSNAQLEPLPMQIQFDIENATTVENLTAIYNENKDWQNDERFTTMLSTKKSKIQKQ